MSTLIPSLNAGITRVLVSYDIACQWHKHLQTRLKSYDTLPYIELSALKYWRVAIPKFHLPGHGSECQVTYNLAYTKWAGRMDGERIEAGWAQANSMATWTRESGPNARRGILDDHWNASNWRKVLGLRECPISPPPSLIRAYILLLLQVFSLTRICGGRLRGKKPNERLQPSYPGVTRPTSSPSGTRCGTPTIMIPTCRTHMKKLKTVRFLSLII